MQKSTIRHQNQPHCDSQGLPAAWDGPPLLHMAEDGGRKLLVVERSLAQELHATGGPRGPGEAAMAAITIERSIDSSGMATHMIVGGIGVDVGLLSNKEYLSR